jgi:hypothetical protein
MGKTLGPEAYYSMPQTQYCIAVHPAPDTSVNEKRPIEDTDVALPTLYLAKL